MFTYLTKLFSMSASVHYQYLLPKRLLTRIGGAIARFQGGWLTTSLIRWFIKKYKVNMLEAENPDPCSYATFNSFFTRALKAGARTFANSEWICPVDGSVSQFGVFQDKQIFQAKGHWYSVQALLAGDSSLASQFNQGNFACLYLSPRDYHRIHMPIDATLQRMIYVPGELFSVSPATAGAIPNLFARNERVICIFDTQLGTMAMVLIGATIVGSISTVWHGPINPTRTPGIMTWDYPTKSSPDVIQLKQGEEMGRFMLGSTVIVLWSAQSEIQFNPAWTATCLVRLGEAMAGLKR